jgi:hypothetical protein
MGHGLMDYSIVVINKQGEIIFQTRPYKGDCEVAGKSMKRAADRWEKRGYSVEFREHRIMDR